MPHPLLPEKVLLIRIGRVLKALAKYGKLHPEVEAWLSEMERRGHLDDPPETLRQEGIVP